MAPTKPVSNLYSVDDTIDDMGKRLELNLSDVHTEYLAEKSRVTGSDYNNLIRNLIEQDRLEERERQIAEARLFGHFEHAMPGQRLPKSRNRQKKE